MMRARSRSLAAVAIAALGLAGCAGHVGAYAAIECAPYARRVTGVALTGPAAAWWDEAAGRYARTTLPAPGSIMVFRPSARLPDGHVAVVTAITAPRAVLVTQANWVHHRIARAEPVIDVSPGNDWSLVRVWWQPAAQMGVTAYPTFGFILPRG